MTYGTDRRYRPAHVLMFFAVIVPVVILAAVLIATNVGKCAARPGDKAGRLRAAIAWLSAGNRRPLKPARARLLASLFMKYGQKWNVDPWLAVSVSFQESGFRNKPRRIRVWRCKKVPDGEVCVNKWPGDRGMMQIVPAYARDSFTACKELVSGDHENLHDTETSVCVGVHLMAHRRAVIAARKQRRGFVVRGARYKWTRNHGPCSARQLKFCRNGYAKLCKKFWWIASWNWGSHRLFCGGKWQYDFPGYPIRVLKRYRRIVKKFRKRGGPGRKT